MNVTINTDRLCASCLARAAEADCRQTEDKSLPAPTQAVTRIVFTPRDLEARAWLTHLAETAGFSIQNERHRQHLPALGRFRAITAHGSGHQFAYATRFPTQACVMTGR